MEPRSFSEENGAAILEPRCIATLGTGGLRMSRRLRGCEVRDFPWARWQATLTVTDASIFLFLACGKSALSQYIDGFVEITKKAGIHD